MKKGTIMFLLGSIVGAGAAYVASTKREEIMKKIQELQEEIKTSDLPEKARKLFKEIIDNIQMLISTSQEALTESEKRDLLEEVEVKIQKLEEAMQREQ